MCFLTTFVNGFLGQRCFFVFAQKGNEKLDSSTTARYGYFRGQLKGQFLTPTTGTGGNADTPSQGVLRPAEVLAEVGVTGRYSVLFPQFFQNLLNTKVIMDKNNSQEMGGSLPRGGHGETHDALLCSPRTLLGGKLNLWPQS